MRSWREAWDEALYGPGGFYRRPEGPGGHFTTSSHGDLGRVLARAVLGLAQEVGASAVVDLGAGRGELLAALAASGTPLTLVGVDVVEPPPGLPAEVAWHRCPGGSALPDLDASLTTRALVVANEWLDVVPCTVAEVDGDGRLREVLVDVRGDEQLGDLLTEDELAWADRWWPTSAPGERVEVGLSRDAAWASLLDRWRPLAALAVDYGHDQARRPPFGSLVGYRDGGQVRPVPDGSCDLTAHVAHDALRHDLQLPQRDALARWAPAPPPPDPDLARTDPLGYVRALSDRSAHAAVAGALGDFTWTVRGPVGPVSAAG